MENTNSEIPKIVSDYIENIAQKYTKNKIKIVKKSDSKLMRLIGWFFSITKINPKFMENYYTTIGSTIYVPDRSLESRISAITLLGVVIHECIHIKDNAKYGMLFNISYLFPQILAVFSLLSLLAIFFSKLWLLCLLFLLWLAPIPSMPRYFWEIRAYRTAFLIFSDEEIIRSEIRKWISNELTTRYYYWTWPFPKYIDKDLSDMSFLEREEYKEIKEFLDKNLPL